MNPCFFSGSNLLYSSSDILRYYISRAKCDLRFEDNLKYVYFYRSVHTSLSYISHASIDVKYMLIFYYINSIIFSLVYPGNLAMYILNVISLSINKRVCMPVESNNSI